MDRIIRFMKNALIPYRKENPNWNLTAIITIGGFILLGLSALMSQIPGFGRMDPTVIEVGKFAFYTGIGRATMPHQHEEETK